MGKRHGKALEQVTSSIPLCHVLCPPVPRPRSPYVTDFSLPTTTCPWKSAMCLGDGAVLTGAMLLALVVLVVAMLLARVVLTKP